MEHSALIVLVWPELVLVHRQVQVLTIPTDLEVVDLALCCDVYWDLPVCWVSIFEAVSVLCLVISLVSACHHVVVGLQCLALVDFGFGVETA